MSKRNMKLETLARLASNVGYTRERLCLRHEEDAQMHLAIAASNIESAIQGIENAQEAESDE